MSRSGMGSYDTMTERHLPARGPGGLATSCAGGTAVADRRRVLRYLTLGIALLTAPAGFAQTGTQTDIRGFQVIRISVGGQTLSTNADDEYVVGYASCHDFLGLGDLPSSCPGDGGTTTDVVTTDTTTTTDAATGDTGSTDSGTGAVAEMVVEVSTTEDPTSELTVAVGKCTESDPQQSDTCEILEEGEAIASLADLDFEFDVNRLIGDTCEEGRQDTVSVYFLVTDVLGIERYNRVEIQLRYDRPESPVIEEVVEGEENVKLDWTDVDSDRYRVYYGPRTFTTSSLGSDIQSESFQGQSEGQIDGLQNGLTYYFGVVSVDSFGNESEICSESELVSTAPVPVDDFFEYYKRNGGVEEGGFSVCFVATAAWESPLAPAVTWLRQYRDTRMLTNDGGRSLVHLYYTVGPEAAKVVAQHDWLKVLARVLLLPLVVCSLLFVVWPVWGPALGGLLAWAGYRRARRRKAEGPTS